MVRKRNGKSEKTEKQKFKTADKISYFGQRRHLNYLLYGEDRMKRKFLIVLPTLTLAIVSAFTLTACGETEKPGGDNG